MTTHLIRSDKDNNALLEVADKIDAEKLFSSLYLEQLKSLIPGYKKPKKRD
ncbi:hypothetical protein BTM113_08520 [Helicobacter pylori]